MDPKGPSSSRPPADLPAKLAAHLPSGDLQAEVAARLAAIRRRIGEACAAAGRRSEEVTLVAVSKRQPLELIAAAHVAGQRVFGENRVQEAAGKVGLLPADAEWPAGRDATTGAEAGPPMLLCEPIAK